MDTRAIIGGLRTATQLILNLDVLLGGHAEKRGNAVAVGVPVCEAAGGHAARRLRRGGVVRVGHDGGFVDGFVGGTRQVGRRSCGLEHQREKRASQESEDR